MYIYTNKSMYLYIWATNRRKGWRWFNVQGWRRTKGEGGRISLKSDESNKRDEIERRAWMQSLFGQQSLARLRPGVHL